MYKDFYCYPAVFERGKEGYGVFFPDFDGCISGEDELNVQKAIKNAKEALSLHLYGMEEDGNILPEPTSPSVLKLKANQFTVMIDVHYGIFKEKMNKKSMDKMVTLPRYLNAAAREQGINLSQFLQEKLKDELGL
jgi:predicted RNase H-like HicB family nuclease